MFNRTVEKTKNRLRNLLRQPSPGSASPKEEEYFRWCIAQGRTYLGDVMAATQGQPIRHVYMREVVRLLARDRARPLRLLEIGSWAGGSAITYGKALQAYAPKGSCLVCVDPWTPYAFTRGNTDLQAVMTSALKTGEIFELFQHNVQAAGVDDLIIIVRARSRDALPLLRPRTFDLVFVDGDHRYDFVREDLLLSRDLVAPEGILCGDDLERQLFDVDQHACIANMDEGFVVDPRTRDHFHPGVTLAVHEVLGAVGERSGFWASRRRGDDIFGPLELQALEESELPDHFSRHHEYNP